jgi:Fe-S-cluster containining protein
MICNPCRHEVFHDVQYDAARCTVPEQSRHAAADRRRPCHPVFLPQGHQLLNACCANIDISLTPYDIVRLKNRLGISSTVFLRDYTVPYEIEKDSIVGVKYRPVDGGTACRSMKPEGCGVYEDRPTACRYYPVALLSMRRQDEFTDTQSYALVKEDHCKGHEVDRKLTVGEYQIGRAHV